MNRIISRIVINRAGPDKDLPVTDSTGFELQASSRFNVGRMLALSDHNAETLSTALDSGGHRSVNAIRVLREYWRADGNLHFSAMPIARAAQIWLGESLSPRHSHVVQRHPSADGTIKLLVGFEGSASNSPRPVPRERDRVRAFENDIDHGPHPSPLPEYRAREKASAAIECVLMPSHRPDRAAACISSQIGCAMGCDFCASTKNGFDRNLGVGEIVEQFMHLRAEARIAKRRIASLVFMGMGEPMLNLEHVIPAIRLLAEPGLGAMGFRAITVSTVGIVPGIDELAASGLGVHLALSLHAPDDETRGRLIPSNRRWPVGEILAAAKRYQERVGRPVNVEYCMLAGVNVSDQQAHLLAKLMSGFRAHVNLIPYNSIGPAYQRPSDERIARFAEILREKKVVTHIRQTRGDDVSAACGQLRAVSGMLQPLTAIKPPLA